MELTLYYGFSKKKNSTKLPSGGTTINANMKENTSIENPTFILHGNIDMSLNYVSAFGRYYFVTDIIRGINELTIVQCEEDVLATHRAEILSYNAFVERSYSTYDNMITDEFLSSKQELADVRAAETSASADFFNTTGCYIVRCVSGEAGEGITTYAIEPSNLASALSYIYNNKADYLDVIGADDTRTLALYNPLDYIASCKWYPFNITQFGGDVGTFHVAWWNTGVGCRILDGKAINQSIPLNYPSTHYYTDWRRFHPNFTHTYLYLPGYGNIEIPSIYLSSQLYADCTVDVISGQIQYIIQEFDGQTIDGVIMSLVGQVGIDVMLGQVNSASYGEVASSFGSAISKAITGDFSGTFSTVQTLLSQTPNSVGTSGGSGSLKIYPYIYITEIAFSSAEYPLTVAGRPLYKNVVLGTLSGFCKCAGASIDISGFSDERDLVNSYLNSGFYIE